MEKKVEVAILSGSCLWFVKGVYYPARRGSRVDGLQVEPDEAENVRIDEVFVVAGSGEKVNLPLEVLNEKFVEELSGEALITYKDEVEAAEADYYEDLRKEEK